MSRPEPDPAPPAAAGRRAALAFIFVTVLIDIIAFGVVIPVLPQLIKTMAGGSYVDAAHWIFVISTSFAVVQFVCTPIQGALSDRYEPFISRAELTLRTGHGRVLATGQYRYDARQWRASQWASTHDKLDAVVTALVANP